MEKNRLLRGRSYSACQFERAKEFGKMHGRGHCAKIYCRACGGSLDSVNVFSKS